MGLCEWIFRLVRGPVVFDLQAANRPKWLNLSRVLRVQSALRELPLRARAVLGHPWAQQSPLLLSTRRKW